MMPPSGPGRSEIEIEFCSVVWITMLGSPGTPAKASVGTSAASPQNPPTQIGWSGLPCSNSIHTPAPTWGTTYTPIIFPAIGTQGMAQLDVINPDTSGTWT